MTAVFGCVVASGTFLVPGHATLARLSAVTTSALLITFVGLVLIAELKRGP
jgi:hypothetical protein